MCDNIDGLAHSNWATSHANINIQFNPSAVNERQTNERSTRVRFINMKKHIEYFGDVIGVCVCVRYASIM